MKTVITHRARADLRAIGRYIAKDNRHRAITFIGELLDKCLDIASIPGAFPLVEGHEADGIRRRLHGNYLIFYMVEGSVVTILQIRNGSRSMAGILFNED